MTKAQFLSSYYCIFYANSVKNSYQKYQLRINTFCIVFFYQDSYHRRSPHLVPYNKVDESIKKANRYIL